MATEQLCFMCDYNVCPAVSQIVCAVLVSKGKGEPGGGPLMILSALFLAMQNMVEGKGKTFAFPR